MREVRLNAGAGFVVAICGEIMTMPGLPKTPAAVNIDVTDDGRITGLSKLARLADVYAKRPQVQERLTVQIADALVRVLEPRGALVVIEAEHLCMSMRGVQKEGASTMTSRFTGVFEKDAAEREKFLALVRPTYR